MPVTIPRAGTTVSIEQKRQAQMSDKEELIRNLGTIEVPGTGHSLSRLNLVREADISGGTASVTLASTGLTPKMQDRVKKNVIERAKLKSGVTGVNVAFTGLKAPELNQINRIIAVMSGKGGVGKSLVSALVGIVLKQAGLDVGILDADITGPSVPRMFGINSVPVGNEYGILPVTTRSGIDIMSINLVLPSEDEAVIWRGPLIAGAIRQFGEEVLWGRLDYLVIDLPPGTADAPLTVMQSFDISGIILVFTPQDLVEMIVRKALNMARKMDKKVLGVVENMSYLYLQELDKRIEIFGRSRAEQMAMTSGAPLLCQIPIDPELARLCDQGKIEEYDGPVVRELADNLMAALKTGKRKG